MDLVPPVSGVYDALGPAAFKEHLESDEVNLTVNADGHVEYATTDVLKANRAAEADADHHVDEPALQSALQLMKCSANSHQRNRISFDALATAVDASNIDNADVTNLVRQLKDENEEDRNAIANDPAMDEMKKKVHLIHMRNCHINRLADGFIPPAKRLNQDMSDIFNQLTDAEKLQSPEKDTVSGAIGYYLETRPDDEPLGRFGLSTDEITSIVTRARAGTLPTQRPTVYVAVRSGSKFVRYVAARQDDQGVAILPLSVALPTRYEASITVANITNKHTASITIGVGSHAVTLAAGAEIEVTDDQATMISGSSDLEWVIASA